LLEAFAISPAHVGFPARYRALPRVDLEIREQYSDLRHTCGVILAIRMDHRQTRLPQVEQPRRSLIFRDPKPTAQIGINRLKPHLEPGSVGLS
jgi:hypothetical protein